MRSPARTSAHNVLRSRILTVLGAGLKAQLRVEREAAGSAPQANTFETFGKLFGLGRDAGKRMFNAIRAMCSWGGLSDTPRCDTRALLTSTGKGKEFAERFDKLGRKWEGDQIKLASPENILECACCNETKPGFLMTLKGEQCLRCARRNQSEHTFGFSRFSGSETHSSNGTNLKTGEVDLSMRHNDAWLRSLHRPEPEFFPIEPGSCNFPGMRNPFHLKACPFADCTDAEIALVRKSIPCIELKMLKCGGTISKTHSVCVPNKVDVVDEFPRNATSAG
mmetsp:Transcript_41998/g.101102  ORF Transcript_41998/g.101102 Transcript_41998/m.101102 type:complete len:279 (-) Transcript_41998:164-1000(-)